MVRLRSANVAPPSPSPAAQRSRQALKEKTNTVRHKPKTPVYEDDGNTEDLVKTAKPRRGRPRKAALNEDQLLMAGGLGSEEPAETAAEVPRSEPPLPTSELVKGGDIPPPAARANRRPPRMTRKIVQSAAQNEVLDGLKKRMEEAARVEIEKRNGKQPSKSTDVMPAPNAPPAPPPATRQATTSIDQRSELSLSPSPPPAGTLSAMGGKRSSLAPSGSVFRSQRTPAIESSILALKNFKRRPRQLSMLQMVQQRTAGGRPSATAVTAADSEGSSADDLDLMTSEDDAGDDFAPEAEGTPLHIGGVPRLSSDGLEKHLSHAIQSVELGLGGTQSKKRKSGSLDASSNVLRAPWTKRRKSGTQAKNDETLDINIVNHPAQPSSSPAQASPQLSIGSNVQVGNSPSSPLGRGQSASTGRYSASVEAEILVPSTAEEQGNHDDLRIHVNQPGDAGQHEAPGGTMADPVSSSPPPFEPVVERQRTDEIAEPITQTTQPSPKRGRPRRKPKEAAMSTSTLQSLLPKQRRPLKTRPKMGIYAISSDSDSDDGPLDSGHRGGGDDEDELGASPAAVRKRIPTPGKKARGTKPTRGLGRGRRAGTAAAKSIPTAAGPVRTYRRTAAAAAAASDKENAGYDDDDSAGAGGDDSSAMPEVSMYEASTSAELEAARRKFARVDEWEMEFESMSAEEHRSSSLQWR